MKYLSIFILFYSTSIFCQDNKNNHLWVSLGSGLLDAPNYVSLEDGDAYPQESLFSYSLQAYYLRNNHLYSFRIINAKNWDPVGEYEVDLTHFSLMYGGYRDYHFIRLMAMAGIGFIDSYHDTETTRGYTENTFGLSYELSTIFKLSKYCGLGINVNGYYYPRKPFTGVCSALHIGNL